MLCRGLRQARFVKRLVDESKVAQIRESYLGYWNHIRFRKGWATPAFKLEDVDEELWEAAEHSAAILEHISSDGEQRLFQRGGDSSAFLSSVSYDPSSQRQKFIRELVHSTLSDSKGYVHDLTEEKVDMFMKSLESRKLAKAIADIARRIPSNTPHYEEILRNFSEAERCVLGIPPPTPPPEHQQPTQEQQPEQEEEAPEPETEPVTSPPEDQYITRLTAYKEAIESLAQATEIPWDKVKKNLNTFESSLDAIETRLKDNTSRLTKDLSEIEQYVQMQSSPVSEKVQNHVKDIHELARTFDDLGGRIEVLRDAVKKERQRQEKDQNDRKLQDKQRKQLRKIYMKAESWERFRISPRFSSSYEGNLLILTTTIPDIDTSTLRVNISRDNVLSVYGTALPDSEQVDNLIHKCIKAVSSPAEYNIDTSLSLEEICYQLSEGRWGSLEAMFKLPGAVSREHLRVQCLPGGDIKIVVPFMQ
eukprot:TRINITY_DN2274_c0_g1_i1.p1 TRINITY_DN2274_c0_g1~~TRINITY_DN2274_c0_g1_i1.p1  ORF type:complete len:476 (+),score=83.46 TRINITY_DN2274_c0_g1_i1:51-1478(+)